MLVYLKSPMGIMDIGGYTVHGRKYAYGSFGPTDIPKELYREHRDLLINALYTKKWLDAKYKKEFPPVTFTAELDIEDDMLKTIAELVGVKITYGKRHELTIQERNAVRRSILLYLSD